MSMIFRRQNKSSTKCPSCGLMNPGLSSDLLQCRRCLLNYRRIEEVQDIEIGNYLADVQGGSVHATSQNVSFKFPRPRLQQVQSLEDDIGRYKHVQLVDVDFKISQYGVGQQIAGRALKLNSRDLADTECLAEKLAHLYGLSGPDSLALSRTISSQRGPISLGILSKKKLLMKQALQQQDKCEQGYEWSRVAGGYRCAGGSHFKSEAQLQSHELSTIV
ncbi:hypothetical protein V8C42DRAFT_274955 [Trichoderma barbatum]